LENLIEIGNKEFEEKAKKKSYFLPLPQIMKQKNKTPTERK